MKTTFNNLLTPKFEDNFEVTGKWQAKNYLQ